MEVILLPLVPLCAFADRIRGGLFSGCRHCDFIGEIVYGAALAGLLGLPWYLYPWLALGWFWGGRPGWGYPMGWAVTGQMPTRRVSPGLPPWPIPHPEWWQIGPLKSLPWLSLVVRGAMWSVPCLPLAYWYPQAWALLGMAVAMPAGALLDRTLTYRWHLGELARGGLMGLICWLA
jgi:hypothetical protein